MFAAAPLLRAASVEYVRDRAQYLAVAMIYYALVSLVPLLLLLLAALGLLLRFSTVAGETRQQMLAGIEASLGPELRETMTRLLDDLQQQSIVATAVSLGGLLLAASVLFRHLRLAFRAMWQHEPLLTSGPVRAVMRATILERAVAFAMVLGGGALLLAALAMIAATQWLVSLPVLGPALGWLLPALGSLGLATLTFAALFRALPPVALTWRDVWPAALLCAAAWVAASELLALFGAALGGRWGAYGALGRVLAVMLWMNVVSQVTFFGAELCKVSAVRRASGPGPRADPGG